MIAWSLAVALLARPPVSIASPAPADVAPFEAPTTIHMLEPRIEPLFT